MTTIAPAQLLQQLNWRYAVKRFDPSRRLDAETWSALEQAMILTPSSYGLQPWRFYVIASEEEKAKLPAISWNQKQPQDCSHMVVFAAKESLDADYVDRFMEQIETTRELAPNTMNGYRNVLVKTIEGMATHLDWNSRQVYIALGQLMFAAALLGVDTCPMEGIVSAEYDKLLGLEGSGFRTVVGCAVGYRHPEDTQAAARKVRFTADELVHHR